MEPATAVPLFSFPDVASCSLGPTLTPEHRLCFTHGSLRGAITLAYETRNAGHGSWYDTRNTITHKLPVFLLC
ncbi:hypothetical protein E2C01_052468 [Portunus trituberculatus]|uniref:Uncharacterized protein n=1 Tax=Portunus trituberculatus TaxID=210409 RepID=A0A5B7GLW3_PORTR|nr:hypothetical protein [Portunus trituberculatus]